MPKNAENSTGGALLIDVFFGWNVGECLVRVIQKVPKKKIFFPGIFGNFAENLQNFPQNIPQNPHFIDIL